MNHNIAGPMNAIKCDAQGALNYISSAGTPHGTFISIKDAAALLDCSRRFFLKYALKTES